MRANRVIFLRRWTSTSEILGQQSHLSYGCAILLVPNTRALLAPDHCRRQYFANSRSRQPSYRSIAGLSEEEVHHQRFSDEGDTEG